MTYNLDWTDLLYELGDILEDFLKTGSLDSKAYTDFNEIASGYVMVLELSYLC